jgi:signal transduction histidine kinase
METLTVMIVDDEPGMRMGVQRALRDHRFHVPEGDTEVGFTIVQAETGEEALEKINAAPPDILLLDHKLPGISGIEVLEQLPDEAETLTIMITAYASIETAVRATKEGAYDFLPKPFTPAELRYAVQKAAGRVVIARQARKLAEEKKRVRFEFIRVLGHELKAPLGAVENYLELLDSQTLGAEITAYEKVIDRSRVRLAQMRKLIVDLLDMTKIESGARPRELTDVNVTETARHAIELMETQAAERDITLNLHAEDQDIHFLADQSEMDMILNNLVSNAVKYNRDGGRVDVTLRRDEDKLVLEVADTGIGMSKEEADKLFGEFVRIKNEKTRNILGSGLGLSIVKRLAEMYHGDARVESAPDVGTTFTIELQPAQQAETQPLGA